MPPIAAVRESVPGTLATFRLVHDVVAIRGKADVPRIINFGND